MKKYFLLFLAFALTIASCTVIPKYVYTPPTANFLTPERKGNADVAVNYSTAGSLSFITPSHQQSNGVDVQAAYALSEKAAIRADFYSKSERNDSDPESDNGLPDYSNRYHKTGGEVSAGYMMPPVAGKRILFQVFGGVGLGKFKIKSEEYDPVPVSYFHNMNYFKAFVQPALRIRRSDNLSLYLATRVSLMSYSNIQTDLPDLKDEPLGYIGTKPSFFTDIIFQIHFGFKGLKGIKFQAQTGYTGLRTHFAADSRMLLERERYDYNNIWFAVGISSELNKLFSKK